MMYHVEIHKTKTGYSAHVAEAPGCIAAASTLNETEALILEALQMHLELDAVPAHEFRVSA